MVRRWQAGLGRNGISLAFRHPLRQNSIELTETMVRLKTKDASILARVAQFERLPRADRLSMLNDASPTARKIGRIVIGTSTEGSPEIRRAARALKLWAAKNRALSTVESEPLTRALEVSR